MIWPKLCIFSNKLPCFGVSMNLWAKGCKKWLNSWKSTKNHGFGKNFATFRRNYYVFAFGWTFQKKVAKSASFREKARKTIDMAKTFKFSSKLPCLGIFMNFSARSCKKCLIPWESTRNHRFGQNYATFSNKLPCLCIWINFSGKSCKKCLISWNSTKKSLIWQKLCNFWNKLQCLFPFDELSRKKLQKVRRLVKKHEKSSILSTCNFPRKLPCFDVSMNIAAKSCKKLLVPWRSTKNHQFGQIFATFRTNFDVFAFRWIFKEKVAKSASFRETARKLINLAKALQILEQATMSFSSWWTFNEKVAKSASFREKARKIIDLAKTLQLFEQTTMFWHFDEVSAKSYKKCLISWKSTKNRRFGENSQLFQQTTMFWRFGELFSEKLQKVPRFLRKL